MLSSGLANFSLTLASNGGAFDIPLFKVVFYKVSDGKLPPDSANFLFQLVSFVTFSPIDPKML
jgi:hypothetical protein